MNANNLNVDHIDLNELTTAVIQDLLHKPEYQSMPIKEFAAEALRIATEQLESIEAA